MARTLGWKEEKDIHNLSENKYLLCHLESLQAKILLNARQIIAL